MAASYISEIEAGKAKPGPEFFVRFAAAYNVNMNYLFLGTGDMFVNLGQKMDIKEFNFDREVESIDTLVWLMEHSSFFKNTMLSLATKTILENEPLIRRSLQKNLPAKEEDRD